MSALTCTHVHLKDGNNMIQETHQGPQLVAQRQGLTFDQELAFKGQVLSAMVFVLIRTQTSCKKNSWSTRKDHKKS